MRRSVVGAVALAGLSVVGLVSPAGASGKFRVVEFRDSTVATPSVINGSPSCDAAGDCVFGYGNTVQVSGDLRGVTVENGVVYSKAGASTSSFTILGVFTGTLDGCGFGSFAISVPLAIAGSAPISGPMSLVPGSGTGDFAGMSQVGQATFTYDPATSTGTGAGRMRCKRS